MRIVFKDSLVLFLQKVRVQEKEEIIEAQLLPEMARRMASLLSWRLRQKSDGRGAGHTYQKVGRFGG